MRTNELGVEIFIHLLYLGAKNRADSLIVSYCSFAEAEVSTDSWCKCFQRGRGEGRNFSQEVGHKINQLSGIIFVALYQVCAWCLLPNVIIIIISSSSSSSSIIISSSSSSITIIIIFLLLLLLFSIFFIFSFYFKFRYQRLFLLVACNVCPIASVGRFFNTFRSRWSLLFNSKIECYICWPIHPRSINYILNENLPME